HCATLYPYTTLFRSRREGNEERADEDCDHERHDNDAQFHDEEDQEGDNRRDREDAPRPGTRDTHAARHQFLFAGALRHGGRGLAPTEDHPASLDGRGAAAPMYSEGRMYGVPVSRRRPQQAPRGTAARPPRRASAPHRRRAAL